MKLKILIAGSGGTSTRELNYLHSVLEDTDYTLAQYAADLNDAVKSVLDNSSDILICLNRSPDFIAAKLLRLTAGRRKLPVIVISEQDDSQRMRECFLLGAIDFLSEPIPPEDLLSALARAASMIHEQIIETEYKATVEHCISALPQRDEIQPLVEKLRTFLMSIQDQTATVELAADFFGFNRDYFGRYFKNKAGMTFGDFYKSLQIEYAERLLETGQFKVLEVSRLLGFSTPDYFTRVFKKYTGKTPSDLKR